MGTPRKEPRQRGHVVRLARNPDGPLGRALRMHVYEKLRRPVRAEGSRRPARHAERAGTGALCHRSPRVAGSVPAALVLAQVRPWVSASSLAK